MAKLDPNKAKGSFDVVDPNEAKKDEVITELKETIEVFLFALKVNSDFGAKS
jgi:hypothetical protein